ncbi:MAG: HAMP domain-containing sensor histidine kinase [Sphingomicrobium sp.]
MASAPSDPRAVLGRVDAAGRLIAADPELAALQAEAGSHLGEQLALPQVAAVARMARKLGVPVSRPAVVAGAEQDVELWVKAMPEGDEVALTLERWAYRSPSGPRLSSLVPADKETVAVSGAAGEWSTDDELNVVSISDGLAALLGVAADSVAGRSLTRLFRLEEDDAGELPLIAALATRREFSGQRARPRGGGRGDALLLLSGEVVTNTAGAFAGFNGRAVPQHSPDPATAQSSAAKPASTAFDLAIDEALRTPLDRIIASADRIVERSDGPLRADYATYASDISAAARHLLSVIRAMNTGSAEDRDTIDLAALTADACALLETAAEARGIAIAAHGSGSLKARGEARGVVQILVNLIGNAIRHSPEGGPVEVSFERLGETALVHVANHGSGIAEADQQRIFERFEQAGSDAGETGLGLAIARRLARAMGGEISLASAPGEGARFTLSLTAA